MTVKKSFLNYFLLTAILSVIILYSLFLSLPVGSKNLLPKQKLNWKSNVIRLSCVSVINVQEVKHESIWNLSKYKRKLLAINSLGL